MADLRLSRRIFLAGAGALAAGTLLGCGSGAGSAPTTSTTAWRLSGRGRRVSNAAKANNANKRFATEQAALAGRAHAGDSSRPVPIDVSAASFSAWFGSGAQVVDLRSA